MRGLMAFAVVWLVVALTGCASKAFGPLLLPDAQSDPVAALETLPPFNQAVMASVARYPVDGTHDYWWPKKGESPQYDGVSRDIRRWGDMVLTGEPKARTFCCGLTLEVFLDTWNEWVKDNPVAAQAFRRVHFPEFKRDWFVRELNGPGPSLALERLGIGRTIPEEEVLTGDFVQLWRTNKSGHSVVFLAWVRNPAGEIVGMRYWSTQPGTDGINEATEYFEVPEAQALNLKRPKKQRANLMVRDSCYYARVEPPLQVATLRPLVP